MMVRTLVSSLHLPERLLSSQALLLFSSVLLMVPECVISILTQVLTCGIREERGPRPFLVVVSQQQTRNSVIGDRTVLFSEHNWSVKINQQ